MLHFQLTSPVELLWFGEFISPAHGWRHLTRRLYEYELMVVTEGELWIADEDREYHVKSGEYLIMSPTRHQHGTRTCRCRFYWMHFRCGSLPADLSLPPKGGYSDSEAIDGIAKALLASEARAPRSICSRYLATSLLLALGNGAPAEEAQPSSRRVLTNAVKNFVTYHRFSEIRVKDIAREIGYHEKYISAVFHETEGITLKRYIIGERLNEAKRLLAETDYTVAEASNYLNFESPHNFSRFFKAETGMTAGAFREHIRTQGDKQ